MSVHKVTRFNQVVSAFLVAGDIVILNSLFYFSGFLLQRYVDCSLFTHDIRLSMILITLCYLVCSAGFGVVLADRVIRPEQIVRHIVKVLVAHCLLFVFALQVWDNHQYTFPDFSYYVIILWQLCCLLDSDFFSQHHQGLSKERTQHTMCGFCRLCFQYGRTFSPDDGRSYFGLPRAGLF
jgi:hypothetical protein